MAKLIKVGDEVEVIKDTQCAHMLHEVTNYPREGVALIPIPKGSKIIFERVFSNFFGNYVRGDLNGVSVDVPIQDIEQFMRIPNV